MGQQIVDGRSAWIDNDGDIYLHIGDILFWVVRASGGESEALKKWWESGEMPYPDYRGLSYEV